MSGNAKYLKLIKRLHLYSSYEDTHSDKMYFVYGTADDHHILEYDLQNDTISMLKTVVIQKKMFLDGSQDF